MNHFKNQFTATNHKQNKHLALFILVEIPLNIYETISFYLSIKNNKNS